MTTEAPPVSDAAAATVQRLLDFLPHRYSATATVTPIPNGGFLVSWGLCGQRIELEVVDEMPCDQPLLSQAEEA